MGQWTGIDRRRMLLGALGVGGAVLLGSGCTGGKEGESDAPRRHPVWSFNPNGDENFAVAPAVADGMVVAVSNRRSVDSVVYGLDARSGAPRWQTVCAANAQTPLIVDGVAVVHTVTDPASGEWAGFDARTGAERWRLRGLSVSPAEPRGDNRPFVIDKVVYSLGWAGDPREPVTQAVDPVGGRVLWTTPSTKRDRVHIASAPGGPAGSGIVYETVKADEGSMTVVGLDPATGRRVWEDQPVERDGTVIAYRLTDGQRLWSASTPSGAASTVVAGDGLVHVSEVRQVTAFDAATGAMRWTADTDDSAWWAGATVGNGALFVHTGTEGEADVDGSTESTGAVEVFDTRTGAPRWRFETGTSSRAPLLVTPNAVYAEHRGSQLSALDIATGKPRWQAALSASDGYIDGTPVPADGFVYAYGSGLFVFPDTAAAPDGNGAT